MVLDGSGVSQKGVVVQDGWVFLERVLWCRMGGCFSKGCCGVGCGGMFLNRVLWWRIGWVLLERVFVESMCAHVHVVCVWCMSEWCVV